MAGHAPLPDATLPDARVGCVDDSDAKVVRIVHISDTHNRHKAMRPLIPDGDILVHSGDFSNYHLLKPYLGNWDFNRDVSEINRFMGKLPHKHKIFVAGNHEVNFTQQSREKIQGLLPNVIYLQDSKVQLEGITFYGSPWNGLRTSRARGFTAPYDDLWRHWADIPTNTDVLVTHSPPAPILDEIGVGSSSLTKVILEQIRSVSHAFH